MVGGQAVETRRQRRTAEVAELVGMQLHRQAERARGLEHAPRLRRREADAFAERIHRIDQPFRMQSRQPADGGVDVAVGIVRELGRQRMRGEIRGPHFDAEAFAQCARDPQHLAFAVEVQPVAGLDLQRGHAIAQQRRDPRFRLPQQFVLARFAHRAHGGEDAAAGARDLLVARALQAQFEFGGAVAGEHHVRVAIDQARGGQRIGFDDLVGQSVDIAGQVVAAADVREHAVLPAHCAVLDQAVAGIRIQRCQRGAEDQAVPS